MKRSSGATCNASAASGTVGSLVSRVWKIIHGKVISLHKSQSLCLLVGSTTDAEADDVRESTSCFLAFGALRG